MAHQWLALGPGRPISKRQVARKTARRAALLLTALGVSLWLFLEMAI